MVHAEGGTILWMSTGRVYAPNADTKLRANLRVILEPFCPLETARSSFWVGAEEDSGEEATESVEKRRSGTDKGEGNRKRKTLTSTSKPAKKRKKD